MTNKIRRIFNPTPEEQLEDLNRYKALVEQMYNEKWCSSCKKYIPVPDDLPGVVSASPECKNGGLATKTCLFYDVDEEGRKEYEAFFAKREAEIRERMRKEREHE